MRVNGEGPIPSRIMLVGEAPGAEEERTGLPFVGASGQELNRMLQDAGIMRSECYATNVCKFRPPNNQLAAWIAKAKKDITPAHKQWRGKWVLPQITEGYAELLTEIEMVQPNLIIAFGNLAMLALTGNWGVLKWRGSQLVMNYAEDFKADWKAKNPRICDDSNLITSFGNGLPKVLPTIHPAAVLRQYELRPLVMTDLRRAKRQMVSREYADKPVWNFHVRPDFTKVINVITTLTQLLDAGHERWLDFDIETVGGHIDSVGFSWSRQDALCIPFMTRGNKAGYWSLEEETEIIQRMYVLLTHKNVRIRWQNGLFDAQYIHRHWHFIPRGAQDTMISQHSAFAALPKGLGFLGSMYAEHYIYWKDEGRISSSEPEEKRWTYNLQDCIYTREVGEELTKVLAAYGLTQVDATQQELFYPVLHAMLRGVRVRTDIKAQLGLSINEELSKREAFLYNVLGHQINESSPKQMQALFYEDLKQKPVLKRVKQSDGSFLMRPTVDDEALTFLGRREPLLKPICNAVADIRTLGKWYKDFVMMPVDADGRMRCSFNIAGDAGDKAAETAGVKSAPYTYRLSSSKNPFGSGGNLQTIPSEKSKSSGKAAARGSMDFTLPNIRSMYGPDAGFTFFDMDLDRADMQPVAWEADDPLLKAALKMGADVHILNSFVLDNIEPPPLEELVETHPKYWDHRGPRKFKREFAKVFGHATDYLGKAKTVAEHTGRLVGEVERAQRLYFGRYPGIQKWHTRIIEQVKKHRFVENAFGYRWYIFDRIDDQLMPKAVAWIPQSTVGILINKIWINFYKNIKDVQVLLQVHDSLAGQFPTHRKALILPQMLEQSKVIIPYADPLIIPVGIKTSDVSWGDCV